MSPEPVFENGRGLMDAHLKEERREVIRGLGIGLAAALAILLLLISFWSS